MLSKKTKYGLKALTYIARKNCDHPVQISEIAQSENISQKFLESILLTLRKNGILGSKKGKGGGYYLIKEPKDIVMASIIRILEGPIAMLPCVSLNFYEKCGDCPDEDRCTVHSLMIEVRDNTLKVLENKTLADFTN
ncbi:Rrf2 family transcriptional regulator [Aquimarina sp. AD10]|uniref:Rrf2 family transcriptional regulator n=1 Tax=Aquimarina aggregata TaxID=1642818 RepID=A0A163APR6_9FLAO|nr:MULTISPECIES: Rrf2 family transcriptional regulator [Aquimarina]AXT62959.1 Rrf2 family transcriptional regulator [Aquimarina sp. AD10]KZS40707.1 Rrf2 family transcriptional regulator [Aquimarina aggregata]RKM94594.1 Rrf2 family transcriptional regulator [Aquimarina sp. AD10]